MQIPGRVTSNPWTSAGIVGRICHSRCGVLLCCIGKLTMSLVVKSTVGEPVHQILNN